MTGMGPGEACALPSLYELVRQAVANEAEAEAPVGEEVTYPEYWGKLSLGYARCDALTKLAMALPARSAADAAAQLAVTYRMLRLLEDDPDTPRHEIDSQLRTIRRVVAGILPLLAAVNGIDLAAIGWSEDELHFEFPLQFPL